MLIIMNLNQSTNLGMPTSIGVVGWKPVSRLIALLHIAGLHGLENDLRLLAERLFDQPDHAHQPFALMVAYIVG